MSAPVSRLGLRAAPWVLWFGTLGGGVAWSLHTLTAWSIDETTCRSGHTELAGVPLWPLELGISLFFLAVCGVSTAVSYRQYRLLHRTRPDSGLAQLRHDRAALMTVIGLVGNTLFTIMVLLSTVAVLVVSTCGRSPS